MVLHLDYYMKQEEEDQDSLEIWFFVTFAIMSRELEMWKMVLTMETIILFTYEKI